MSAPRTGFTPWPEIFSVTVPLFWVVLFVILTPYPGWVHALKDCYLSAMTVDDPCRRGAHVHNELLGDTDGLALSKSMFQGG